MSGRLAQAEKSIADMNVEITLAENHLADVTSKVQMAEKRLKDLEESISRKMNDTQVWLNEQKATNERIIKQAAEDGLKMAEAKAAIQAEIDVIKADKESIARDKEFLVNERKRVEALMNRVDAFKIAVNRAYELVRT